MNSKLDVESLTTRSIKQYFDDQMQCYVAIQYKSGNSHCIRFSDSDGVG